MKVKISQRGGDRNNHELYEEAIIYFAERLIHKRFHKKLNFKLIVAKNIHKLQLHGDHCDITKHDHEIRISRRLPFNEAISTIAHEMIHAKQVIHGELKYKSGFYIWKGVPYADSIYDDTPPEDHEMKIPWEKEPYEKEWGLARDFSKLLFNG